MKTQISKEWKKFTIEAFLDQGRTTKQGIQKDFQHNCSVVFLTTEEIIFDVSVNLKNIFVKKKAFCEFFSVETPFLTLFAFQIKTNNIFSAISIVIDQVVFFFLKIYHSPPKIKTSSQI
jgi:hypothetical protein